MLDEDFARGFTELMNCRGLALGQKLAAALEPQLVGKKRLLDVGGGRYYAEHRSLPNRK